MGFVLSLSIRQRPAPSEHLAYGAWKNRGLRYITNNQGGTLIADATTKPMTLYVKKRSLTCMVAFMYLDRGEYCRFASDSSSHTAVGDRFRKGRAGRQPP